MFERLIARHSAGFILAFHDITPDRVAEFIESLYPLQPIPLNDLVSRKQTAGLFAITIDDGVGDTVRGLAKLFLARQWPATFYLPTDYLDKREAMVWQWWRAIRPLLPARRIALKSVVLDLSPPGAIDALSKDMERRWHSERLESYLPLTLELIDYLERENNVSRTIIQPPAAITWPEVERLASHRDLLRFESHGVTHAAMSSLDDRKLEFELRHSRNTITDHTGVPCRHLAYPFGSWQSIGARTADAASRVYETATTMTLGHVEGGNALLLPRIPLYPENSIRVARLKVLLKCTSLTRASAVVA